jgi:hypothetical protein
VAHGGEVASVGRRMVMSGASGHEAFIPRPGVQTHTTAVPSLFCFLCPVPRLTFLLFLFLFGFVPQFLD